MVKIDYPPPTFQASNAHETLVEAFHFNFFNWNSLPMVMQSRRKGSANIAETDHPELKEMMNTTRALMVSMSMLSARVYGMYRYRYERATAT